MKNILEYLENAAETNPDKIAFIEETRSVSYSDLLQRSMQIGTSIARKGFFGKPIIVYIEKSVACIEAMLGVVYSGNYYSVIDTNMPADRLSLIISTLSPAAVLTQRGISFPFSLNNLNFIYIEDCETTDQKTLSLIRDRMIDTDPLYVLFTSGSTGVPKGVVVTHRNVLAYTKWVCKTFDITGETIFGSQVPFYFSMSVTDVFSTLSAGASFVILPKYLFMFPVKLLQFMNDYKVNTIYWVPSALSIVANIKALDVVPIPSLRKILFAGESMPVKQLNVWRRHFPDALFANLFGPTETTDICSYYIVDRVFQNDEILPIGKHCDNCDVLVLNDAGEEASDGEEGELCVRGSFVVPGYYNDPEKTSAVFVRNPLNNAYPEIIYKTGDIVKYNEKGELLYLGRRDSQIKRMGYRIELGEIETAVGSAEEIKEICCIFDKKKSEIVLLYEGNASVKEVESVAGVAVPEYMVPDLVLKIDRMPHNANGKIDRLFLIQNYKQYID